VTRLPSKNGCDATRFSSSSSVSKSAAMRAAEAVAHTEREAMRGEAGALREEIAALRQDLAALGGRAKPSEQ
jgi:hypothetical protein